ncbi:hypothetical protein [uncultured Erythrobacter sp.]|uniref:hypothetical protein n=1 Tax=uncultured Erythrobacter sp. TaxID=263913 RepID=UPI00262DC518|nr:hypothetical protein [uncultured Erythrobacter sp.]
MKTLKKTLTKGAFGTVAAGAMALASATPAMADDRGHRDRGIDAGDVIAGAVIIGGLAALAGAFDNDDRRDRRYRDRDYRGNGYDGNRGYRGNQGYRGGAERAVQRCIRRAERQARRFGGWRYADVTEIRDIDRTRYGFRVRGRMVVEGARGYRGRNADRGRFTCYVERGNRPQIEFRGIQGLR